MTTDPIRKSITVPLEPARAFTLFTEEMDRWWPKDSHSLAAADDEGDKARVRVEPREGGQVIETLPDGSEAAWATVTTWQPGTRFAMRWYVGRPEDEATEVDVSFTATEAGTRIDLTHSGFAALGAEAETMCASYTTGWDHVLGTCFKRACATVPA
ncbi:MAG: SRPBCC domain-containing protein [Pseudomonadota bacterium]